MESYVILQEACVLWVGLMCMHKYVSLKHPNVHVKPKRLNKVILDASTIRVPVEESYERATWAPQRFV